MALQKNAARRMEAIMEYIRAADPAILDDRAKGDLCGWVEFVGGAPDSTTLFRWYGNFHSIIGFYAAALQERITLANFVRDRIIATCRKLLGARKAGRITEGEVKMEANLDPIYGEKVAEIAKLERLFSFLDTLRHAYDSEIVQGFGHNERAEMNADRDRDRR